METIEGIVMEMRDRQRLRNLHYGIDGYVSLNSTKDYLDIISDFADRIEAAYKSQLTSGAMCTMSCRSTGDMLSQYMESEKRLAKENARLKAALQPILDIVMDSATSDLSMELAITEAKRLYNECKEEAKC